MTVAVGGGLEGMLGGSVGLFMLNPPLSGRRSGSENGGFESVGRFAVEAAPSFARLTVC